MNIAQIEEQIQKLSRTIKPKSFIYDLLGAYGKPKASITRLQNGTYNLSKTEGEILWKKNLLFKELPAGDALYSSIDKLRKSEPVSKHGVRFVVVTDYKTLLAVDIKTGDTLDIPIAELGRHFDFFLPWAGFEKANRHTENPADIKAAERMAKLYDEIRKDNPIRSARDLHSLNIFLSRLLFCFFAEDTEIFKKGLFTNSVASHTAENGSDLSGYLDRLFATLNIEKPKNLPKYLAEFPYVNGGLFAEKHSAPEFSRKARKMILECGELDWSAINPDIFGSMIQAVVHPDQRGGMGMHYTSVPNIMKVIQPLFLNELRSELEKAGKSKAKLTSLLNRIYNMRIFDPACGSGNFLIIAYKELCALEIDIFKQLYGDQTSFRFKGGIRIDQFYGIEIDDFAHETAKLSLWLAEHQMNLMFKSVFGQAKPTLPLRPGGRIVCGNALKLDWEEVCPRDDKAEVFVLGNPPYLGGKFQTKEQKAEMAEVFSGVKNFGELDYIASWFIKAARYVRGANAKFGFVTTSSLCQGSQVHQLWPQIFELGLEINFAHKPFAWSNNARANAGVTCSIIGVSNKTQQSKFLFEGAKVQEVKSISAYLIPGSNLIVQQRLKPLAELPPIITGNSAYDGGNLLLTPAERQKLVEARPDAAVLLRRIHGSGDFLDGEERWCLWISDEQLELANSVPEIAERIKKTGSSRKRVGNFLRIS